MADGKSKILIVEDDLDVADMLNAYFRVQGYDVYTVNWGEDGIRAAHVMRPDLFILDIRLPDIDGFEVARRLRSDRRTEHIPIIFLTEKRDRADRLQGLELGADDYITKPFDIQELRLRVRNALRRVSQDTLTNTVTGLPEGPLVDEKLTACLQSSDWAMLVVTLENLEIFRDSYGFVASDDVLRAVSVMIHNAMREIGSHGDFLGHLGPTMFILVITPVEIVALEERVRSRLEQSLDYFYPLKDREVVASSPQRLSIRIGKLLATEGKHDSLDHLKTILVRRKK